MKRIVWFSAFLLLLFIVGCSSNDNENAGEDANTPNNNEQENNEETNNDNGVENNNDTNDEGNQDENENTESENDDVTDGEEETPTPTYEIEQKSWAIEPMDDSAEEDVVLITIDDAPDEHAVEMAHTLKDLDVNAIFFVNGHFLETDEEKEKLKEIYDMGFLIGNHTYSHPDLSELSSEEQREEIVEVSDMVEDIIGERPAFFRAPHGIIPDTTKEVVEEEDMVLMNWTYGYDYFEPYMDKEKITEAMISGKAPEIDENNSLLRPGANLLMHDREWTNDALEDIIKGLRDKGYEMVDPNLIKTKHN